LRRRQRRRSECQDEQMDRPWTMAHLIDEVVDVKAKQAGNRIAGRDCSGKATPVDKLSTTFFSRLFEAM